MILLFWVGCGYDYTERKNSEICHLVLPSKWAYKLDEFEAFLDEHQEPVTDNDEGLVRQLIEKITVYDDHLAFEFKSGIETEVQM